MVKRKKMRGSIVAARADRIYRCLLEGLRTTGRGKLPFAPAYEAPRSSFRFERILFRSKFIPIRQNFRFSDAIFSFPRNRFARNIHHRRIPLVTLYETFIRR